MWLRWVLAVGLLGGAVAPAHAVIVRGRVTDGFGRPLPGARVQLIALGAGTRSAADTISGMDGSYELRSDLAGRFLLLTSPSANMTGYAPQVGEQFYGGRTDLLRRDVALNRSDITPEHTRLETLVDAPLPQLAEAPQQVRADELLDWAEVLPELRPLGGATVVRLGQVGEPARLLVRGAPVTRTEVDGVTAEQLGGGFDVGIVGTAGLAAVESGSAVQVEAGATPLYGLDATAGVLEVRSAEADSAKPVLIYQVDAGNLSTIRQEGTVGVAHGRADALLTFARLNTDNDEPAAKVHEVTWSGDAGYRISGNTGLRATLREDVAAAPLPSPFAFYQVVQETRLARQNVYGGATFETTTASGWHNLLRYGLVRSRAQAFDFGGPSTGVPMTIQSANGYPASGVATFLSQPGREDFVTNRDEGTYQTDGRWKFLRLGGGGRYEDERGADLVTGGTAARLERSHLDAAATVQAEWKHRLFGEASGFVDHESTLGWHGGPRLGATYVPVRPGARKFRGTTLRATAATGTREPSVVETAQVGTTIAANGLPRSRTYSAGVEQELLPRRVSLKVTYFHGQCAHEFETLGLAPLRLGDQLAYRTQGLEASMQWRPAPRLLVAGGYTYLAALVERSAAVGVMNPNVPGVLIGAATGLAGARPFDRAPNTGFVEAEYAGRLVSAGLKATMQGRSDETTGLVLNPTLLLPNRNLSPGYAEVDAQMGVQVTHAIRLYAQATNLANDRHVAPIGYLSTPFAVSVGVRVRLGRE